ncbi:MAG: NADH-quinone oxidoreductase subunit N [Pseudomonadota bacterium]
MTHDQFLATLPLLASTLLVLLIMAAIAIHRCHRTVSLLTIAGLLGTLATLPLAALPGTQKLGILFVVDGHALFYSGLILAAASACALMLRQYLATLAGNREEAYLLLTVSVNGALLLTASQHFASFFMALELMSIPLYALAGYRYTQRRALESATKYLVLSATATSFLLFGMAFLYAQSGHLDFRGIAAQIVDGQPLDLWLAQAGLVLVFAGIAFKLSLAPFHAWTADVYEGAPAPVGAFLATVGKIAVVAVLLRLCVDTGLYATADGTLTRGLGGVLAAVAVLSILVGNLLALRQNNLKRLLAWSSVAHFGYLMIVLVVGGVLAMEAIGMYVTTYVATTLVAFGVLSVLSAAGNERDTETLDGVRALAARSPLLAFALAFAFLSLAGIPLTAGFIGKFYVIAAGADAGRWALLLAVVLGSAIGLWYYLRVVLAVYARAETEAAPRVAGGAGWVAVVAALAAMTAIGLWPQPVIDLLLAASFAH